ncbi:winged helix domain-containing protein [Rhizobium bangladeshense]|uniref:winged helix domain-containing protein n=2 Tax=Rhizobium/Agrobacterium group TaxID=227290 RepID=UPI002180BA97
MNNTGKARTRMRVQIMDKGSPVSSPITVVGRNAWALQTLIDAGDRGFSSIERPAPRTAHYIHRLRSFGFAIETRHEAHGGKYPGTHARYRLCSELVVLEGQSA